MITTNKIHSILRTKMGLLIGRDYQSGKIGDFQLSLIAKFDEGNQIIIDTLKRNGVEADFTGSSVIVNLTQEAKTNGNHGAAVKG